MAINTGYTNLGLHAQNIGKSNVSAPKVENRAVAPSQIPAEKVTLSTPTPLKTARPGSDMAQMLEDLQSNGVLPQSQAESTAVESAKPKSLREPTSDYMSQMVEDVQRDIGARSQSLDVKVGSNGTIAILDDTAYPAMLSSDKATEQHGVEGHGNGHGHGYKEDALLGGHIGTEIIEKIGHSAHHAASHGTSHAVGEAVSHGAAKVGAHKAGAATDAIAEAASHGAAKAGAHKASAAAETVGELADAHEATSHALTVGKEAAHHLSTGLEVALGVGAAGAGILAVPITINGVKELKAGIKEKDTDKILEGVGNLAVGARSAGTAAVMGGMLTTSEVVTQVAGVAAQTLTPLGIVHAGVDTVLGVRDIAKGKVTEGVLKIGTGAAIGAAAIIGGLPLTIAALGMLGVKTGHKIYTHIQEKKQAAHAQEQPPTPPQTGAGEVHS